MAHRKSKGSHKKHKSKKHGDKENRQNIYQIEEGNVKKAGQEVYAENIIQDNLGTNTSGMNIDQNSAEALSEKSAQTNPKQTATNSSPNVSGNNTSTSTSDANVSTNESSSTDLNDLCEEIKAKQQELLNRLRNLNEALAAMTLIRDNVNSLRVDNLTELYFTRQVRPLLDALNIISFASTNMSATATAFQTNAFGDRKEIKEALKLSYKMNGEIEDIINSLGRRLTIFLKQIDNMDKNCPPFDPGKDS